MGGSTVVVEEMRDYLRSLRRVGTLRPARLLPGHGHAIENPAEVVAAYLDHRMAREGQIVAAIRDGAPTVGAVVEAVYSQVDRRLHPAAAVSVLAHLRKLTADGIADLAPHGRGTAESSIWSRRVGCRESRP
jgi:glyoxylase-like metal-dependent hydrolase (beta-lactamase superfamily II)